MSDFPYIPPDIRCHPIWHQQSSRLHHQHLRSIQGGAQHLSRVHLRQDAIHPLGCRQPDAL